MRIVVVWIFFKVTVGIATISNGSSVEDFSNYYDSVRISKFFDYSDVKLLKFHLNGPTDVARWRISHVKDPKCSDHFVRYHFVLQHGTYPLLELHNETFPDGYISTRHDLFETIFNETNSNGTIELRNPIQGHWFAMSFVELLSSKTKSKSSSGDCGYFLTTSVDYRTISIPDQLRLDRSTPINLTNVTSSIFVSYSTSISNRPLTFVVQLNSSCNLSIFIRINGLPSSTQYDYRSVCQNLFCTIELDPISAFFWLYFQLSIDPISCPSDVLFGGISIEETKCSENSTEFCRPSEPMQRVDSNDQYAFLYVTRAMNSRSQTLFLDGQNRSIQSYEFMIDDRNIGGTTHFHVRNQINSSVIVNPNATLLICLSKYRRRTFDNCEDDFKMSLGENQSSLLSLPYPEIANWHLTFEFRCDRSKFNCENASVVAHWRLFSTPCTEDQCGSYGSCRLRISLQNIFSTCSCIAGFRGYGCTDGRQSYLWKYLPSVLFLTLSNLMFIPPVILAIRYRLYIEALVYFFNMFFSTFYHACDQEIDSFCIFRYDGLQLSDFIGSYASFVITLITMSIVPRAVKVFLFMLGILICIAINSRDRFDNIQLIVLLTITALFTFGTWMFKSIKLRQLQPSKREYLLLIPGLTLATVGIILFVFVATDDNYWYVHSVWHLLMASSILFLIPRRDKNKTIMSGFVNPIAVSSTINEIT